MDRNKDRAARTEVKKFSRRNEVFGNRMSDVGDVHWKKIWGLR